MRLLFPLGPLLLMTLPASAQTPRQSPHDLVKDTVYNELQERKQMSLWQYRVDKRVAAQTVVEQEVETVAGPVYRVFSRQGKPLDATAQKKETDRLNNLVHNTSEQARMKQDYLAEEARVERMIGAMPEAFICEYEGEAEGNIRLSFRPNPAYNPQTYEARVFHALSGELWIDPRLKRLVKIDGHIDNEIDFGYGFLGKIEKGGTFKVGREEAGKQRWKTSLVDVHVSGRVVFLKTISKDQREVRSHFQPVASDLSVQDAVNLLNNMPAP